MAEKVVHVSDVSGKEADRGELGKLVVHEHPGYADLPVELDALPQEVENLQSSSRFVTVEWVAPDARRGERMTIGLDDFNLLGEPGRMDEAIADALVSKHRISKRQAGPKRRQATRVNYATLEHAGKPHRGRITDEEKRIVRENLDTVNDRLRQEDEREINPSDSQMQERYGL